MREVAWAVFIYHDLELFLFQDSSSTVFALFALIPNLQVLIPTLKYAQKKAVQIERSMLGSCIVSSRREKRTQLLD